MSCIVDLPSSSSSSNERFYYIFGSSESKGFFKPRQQVVGKSDRN
jgi:hypothetical protein